MPDQGNVRDLADSSARLSSIDTRDHRRAPETSAPEDAILGSRNMNPPGISFPALLLEDFRNHDFDPFSQGFWAMATHRFGNWRMSIRPRVLRAPLTLTYLAMSKACQWFGGIKLDYTVVVGRRVRIWHSGGMTLGAREIGDDTHIRPNTTFGLKKRGEPRWHKPIIGRRCDIGVGAVILGAITVGDDSVVGANVVLSQSVPPGSMVTVLPPVIKQRRPGPTAP